MPSEIYLVTADSGEHADFRQWNVLACSTRDEAEIWQRACQSRYDEALTKNGDKHDLPRGWVHPMDPGMYHDETRPVEYHVEAVPFWDGSTDE